MPNVPYSVESELASINPGAAGNARVTTQVNANSFGAPVAQGLGEVGAKLSESALKDQDYLNTANANTLDVQTEVKLGQLKADLYSRQGKDAIDALPDYQTQVQKVRDEALASASNPAVARTLDNMLSRRVGTALVAGATHIAGETKRYANNAADAKVKLAVSQSAGADEDTFKQNQATIEQTIRENDKANGVAPDQTELTISNTRDAAWGARLTYTATQNAAMALKAYEKNKDQISPNGQQTLEPRLLQMMVTYGSRNTAAAAAAGGNYMQSLMGQESEGGKNIPNRAGTSSAFGPGQITKGTWSDIIKAHPELNLTEADRMDPAKQKLALPAFTADNVKKLDDAELPTTDKTAYMAHFLGADGAVKFLKGLKDDPTASAEKFVDKASLNANDSVFYYGDGSPKSLQTVFDNQTKKFKDVPYGQDAGSESAQLARGKALAEATMPTDKYGAKATEYQEAVATRIRTAFNNDVNVKRSEDQQNVWTVRNEMYGKQFKSADDMLNDAEAGPAFNKLDSIQQGKMIKEIETMNKAERNQDNPARQAEFQRLSGMATTNPKEFMAQDFTKSDITNTSAKALIETQQKIQKGIEAAPDTAKALKTLQTLGVFENSGLSLKDPNGQNTNLHQFTGQLNQLIQTYKESNKSPGVPDAELKKMAAGLLAKQGGWFGSSIGGQPAFRGPVPSDFESRAIKDLPQKLGRQPTGQDIRDAYGRYLYMSQK